MQNQIVPKNMLILFTNIITNKKALKSFIDNHIGIMTFPKFVKDAAKKFNIPLE